MPWLDDDTVCPSTLSSVIPSVTAGCRAICPPGVTPWTRGGPSPASLSRERPSGPASVSTASAPAGAAAAFARSPSIRAALSFFSARDLKVPKRSRTGRCSASWC